MTMKQIEAGVLDVAYLDDGPADGPAVICLHGFPYDVRAYDDVTSTLVDAGCRVITPYLRGYGPTRFLSGATPRSGEQAVLANDLLALMDALDIERAILAGYDWGGRAACIVSALWPERVRGLVTQNGYNVQHIAAAMQPAPPENERRHWYQYYFHGERGRAGLEANRRALCRLLWQTWSPRWTFDDAIYTRTAESFDNPDFVSVVIHSYRHRYGLVAGDPAVAGIETKIAEQPKIGVPAVILDGDADGVASVGGCADHARLFTAGCEYRSLAGIGHNAPQEAPGAFADAVLSLL